MCVTRHANRHTVHTYICIYIDGLNLGELYLSNINPVSYDAICGIGIFLCPLQIVGIVVSFQNPDRVGCIKVKLSIVWLCCMTESNIEQESNNVLQKFTE